MLQPRLPPRERVGVVAAGAVDTGDVQVPYFRGVDCDGDLVHLGRSRADRTALRHLRHLRPRGNSRAARRRHTETTRKREKKISTNYRSYVFAYTHVYTICVNIRICIYVNA